MRKVQLLLTHKGIGLLSALAVVHTLGDISRFPSSKEAVAYTGLDPLERSSAGKVRIRFDQQSRKSVAAASARTSSACRDRYDGELKAFYKRLASRRSKSIAKVAATRKLLIQTFHHASEMELIIRSSKGVARQLECPYCLMVCNDRFLIGLPTCFVKKQSANRTSWVYGWLKRSVFMPE